MNEIQQTSSNDMPRRSHKDLVISRRESFRALLPKNIDALTFERGVIAALVKTPALRNCSETSFLMAVSACAELGLIPNGALGHAYLIPYKQNCTVVVGYKGLVALSRRSGEIESISVREVRANDIFEIEFGLQERCRHVPATGDRGPITGVYCVARFRGGGHHLEYMSVQDVLDVKNAIKGRRSDSPWESHFEEMAKKTVIRRAWKLWPCSTEMIRAAEIEDGESDTDTDNEEKECSQSEIEAMLEENYETE